MLPSRLPRRRRRCRLRPPFLRPCHSRPLPPPRRLLPSRPHRRPCPSRKVRRPTPRPLGRSPPRLCPPRRVSHRRLDKSPKPRATYGRLSAVSGGPQRSGQRFDLSAADGQVCTCRIIDEQASARLPPPAKVVNGALKVSGECRDTTVYVKVQVQRSDCVQSDPFAITPRKAVAPELSKKRGKA
jgi:hypothetical protein